MKGSRAASSDGVLPFTPVVIIGAARSGTNALRDALTRLPGLATWPCDEINPIWRHGNLRYPNDAIPPERATDPVRAYIRSAFYKLWRRSGRPTFIVEKTCANSLRVPFVDRILPEAKFVYIVRDGYDVVASARRRWLGELEVSGLPYFLAKARYSPVSDLPWYALSAIKSRLAVLAGQRDHLGVWGPRFPGMVSLGDADLEEIVARQWAACVEASDEAFSEMTPGKVHSISYEAFVANPRRVISEVAEWLDLPLPDPAIALAVEAVRAGSVGSGRSVAECISPEVRTLMAAPLKAHGYTE